MNEHIIDALTRLAAAEGSRREIARAVAGLTLGGVWSALLGSGDADAKKKRKKKRKKNKKKGNGAISPPPPLPCAGSCAGKVCGDDGCGNSCGVCGGGELCAQGQCVIGQGTCAAGDDVCVDSDHICGNPATAPDCYCRTSMSNQTRCVQSNEIDDEHLCASDAECAALFPETPGVICARAIGENCPGGVGLCYAPCPD